MRIYIFLILKLLIFIPSLLYSDSLKINGTNNSNTNFTPSTEISKNDWSSSIEMERSWKSALVRIPVNLGKSIASTVDEMEKKLSKKVKKFPTVII